MNDEVLPKIPGEMLGAARHTLPEARSTSAGNTKAKHEVIQRNSPHRITSSARTRIDSGIVMPRALAVFRLTINSNFVGCSIGRSAGLAPFRILSTYPADLRNRSAEFAP